MTLDSLPVDDPPRIDERLRELLKLAQHAPPSLRDAMAYGLLAPGKRLRPTLTILAARALGAEASTALSAGCSIEMVHAYSLIHDDLPAMDDDDLRRGQPTVHKKFGEALAILAGDALLTLAFEVLATEYPPVTATACCRELAKAAGAVGMVGGQVEDLTWEGKIPGRAENPTLLALQSIHAAKTGALFLASLRLGLLAAQGERPGGVDTAAGDALDEFGRCFGLAFQITDDLLDAVGNEAHTGKRVGKDESRGKVTYPGLLGVEASRRQVKELALRADESLRRLGEAARPLGALMNGLLDRVR